MPRRRPTPRASSRALRSFLPLAPLFGPFLLAGCTSTGAAEEPDPPYELVSHAENQIQAPKATIGYLLDGLDTRIRAWNNLKLRARSPQEENKLRILEDEVRFRVDQRREELLEQLQFGPPNNRAVAAMALGFSESPEVLPPLLNAVNDPEAEVAGNALLGLGYLALPETPLADVCRLLQEHPDGWTRNNAAYAMQRILAAGGSGDCVLRAARAGLGDTEDGVRAQCSAILGLLTDSESIGRMESLLYDHVPFVVVTTARSLSRIATDDPQSKGEVARALVDSFERTDGDHRAWIHVEMVRLSQVNYGDDESLWREWAYRLP